MSTSEQPAQPNEQVQHQEPTPENATQTAKSMQAQVVNERIGAGGGTAVATRTAQLPQTETEPAALTSFDQIAHKSLETALNGPPTEVPSYADKYFDPANKGSYPEISARYTVFDANTVAGPSPVNNRTIETDKGSVTGSTVFTSSGNEYIYTQTGEKYQVMRPSEQFPKGAIVGTGQNGEAQPQAILSQRSTAPFGEAGVGGRSADSAVQMRPQNMAAPEGAQSGEQQAKVTHLTPEQFAQVKDQLQRNPQLVEQLRKSEDPRAAQLLAIAGYGERPATGGNTRPNESHPDNNAEAARATAGDARGLEAHGNSQQPPVKNEQTPAGQHTEQPAAPPQRTEQHPAAAAPAEQHTAAAQRTEQPAARTEQPASATGQRTEQHVTPPAQAEHHAAATAAAAPRTEQPTAAPAQRTEQHVAAAAQRSEQPAATPVQRTEQHAAAAAQRSEQPAATPVQRTEQHAAAAAPRIEQSATAPGPRTEQHAPVAVQKTEQPSLPQKAEQSAAGERAAQAAAGARVDQPQANRPASPISQSPPVGHPDAPGVATKQSAPHEALQPHVDALPQSNRPAPPAAPVRADSTAPVAKNAPAAAAPHAEAPAPVQSAAAAARHIDGVDVGTQSRAAAQHAPEAPPSPNKPEASARASEQQAPAHNNEAMPKTVAPVQPAARADVPAAANKPEPARVADSPAAARPAEGASANRAVTPPHEGAPANRSNTLPQESVPANRAVTPPHEGAPANRTATPPQEGAANRSANVPQEGVRQPASQPLKAEPAQPAETVAKPAATVSPNPHEPVVPGAKTADTGVTQPAAARPGETAARPTPAETAARPSETVSRPGETVARPGETVARPGESVAKPTVAETQPTQPAQFPGQMKPPAVPQEGTPQGKAPLEVARPIGEAALAGTVAIDALAQQRLLAQQAAQAKPPLDTVLSNSLSNPAGRQQLLNTLATAQTGKLPLEGTPQQNQQLQQLMTGIGQQNFNRLLVMIQDQQQKNTPLRLDQFDPTTQTRMRDFLELTAVMRKPDSAPSGQQQQGQNELANMLRNYNQAQGLQGPNALAMRDVIQTPQQKDIPATHIDPLTSRLDTRMDQQINIVKPEDIARAGNLMDRSGANNVDRPAAADRGANNADRGGANNIERGVANNIDRTADVAAAQSAAQQKQPDLDPNAKMQQQDKEREEIDKLRQHELKQRQEEEEKARKLAEEEKLRLQEAQDALLAAMATKKKQQLKEQEEEAADKLKKDQDKRQKYVVKEGDTLESIAMKMLRDKRLAGLIYQINKTVIPTKLEGGKKVVDLKPKLVIYLPSPKDIQDYRGRLLTGGAAQPGLLGAAEKPKFASAQDELSARFGTNWAGTGPDANQADLPATADDAPTAPAASHDDRQPDAIDELDEAARAAYQARRQRIESLLGPVAPKAQELQPRYVVRLNDTIQSIAAKHPALNDITLWKLLAKTNNLPIDVDAAGEPIATVKRGQLLVLPSKSEIEAFRQGPIGVPTPAAEAPARSPRKTMSKLKAVAAAAAAELPEGFALVKERGKTSRLLQAGTADNITNGLKMRLESHYNDVWTPVVIYEIYEDVSLRHEFSPDGSRKTIRIDLPPSAAVELAQNDLDNNWQKYTVKFRK